MSRHNPREIERIKRVAAKMTVENPAQGSLAAPAGSASVNGLFVGEWCAETIWERAERARVFLAIMGYSTQDEADSIAKRIRRDKTPEGMRLNRIETIDGKPVRCFIEDK